MMAGAFFTAYVATILLANLAADRVGFVPVGFGLEAPAGVYFAGLALGLRDGVQSTLGRVSVVIAIFLGGALSLGVAPSFAVASAVAFTVSELADMAVYTPLKARNLYAAVVASNVVGLVIDSALFLWIAFGSLDFITGQIVAKGYMTLAAVAAIWIWRHRPRGTTSGLTDATRTHHVRDSALSGGDLGRAEDR